MVDLFELRDQLDGDWSDFEAYVEQDENHENPDPRDIQWPNGIFWKAYVLSEAWRVLQGQKVYKPFLDSCDLAFPIANMIVVGYIQFPNSNQRVELTVAYDMLCDIFGVSNDTQFMTFSSILGVFENDENAEWVSWMNQRCNAYRNDPHKSRLTSEQVWESWNANV